MRKRKIIKKKQICIQHFKFAKSHILQYGTLENRYETDSPLCVRLTASANIIDTSIHYKRNYKNKNKQKNSIIPSETEIQRQYF